MSIKKSQTFLENHRKPKILCTFSDKNHILNKICGFNLVRHKITSNSYEDLNICYKSLSVEERIIYKVYSDDFMLDSCDAIFVHCGEKSFED